MLSILILLLVCEWVYVCVKGQTTVEFAYGCKKKGGE